MVKRNHAKRNIVIIMISIKFNLFNSMKQHFQMLIAA